MKATLLTLLSVTLLAGFADAQNVALERKPSDGPFPPAMIRPGGTIIPLYKPDSPMLKKERIHEAEKYNTTSKGTGPIVNVINIHNPSIEVHLAKDRSLNGAAMIVAPGGGHKILWVGPEGADYIEANDKLGISTIVLRNRLRVDGYEPTIDAVNDAFQAIRIVRAHAAEWGLDPNKIGIVGFSAGAELSSPTAVFFEEFEKKNNDPADPLSKVSARPDFVGVIYPGPTPFTKAPETAIPANVPPSFVACGGSGDRVHALWAMDYGNAMLKASVPNIELHIYGRGGHPIKRSDAPDAIPSGKWFDRFTDWFTDLGFLGKPGVETKAAKEVAAYAKKAKK
jgi:hypothetical protein